MKLFKRIFPALLALCVTLGLAVTAAACNDDNVPGDDPEPINYTIAVTCEDEDVLADITVQLFTATGLEAADGKPLTDGKAVFSLAPATYTVEIEGADDYTYPATTVTATSPAATIVLTAKGDVEPEKADYAITVTYPNGDPVPDLSVQLCTPETEEGGVCVSSTTNASGVAAFQLLPAVYEVHINLPPAGYTFDNHKYTVSATELSKTVVLDEAVLSGDGTAESPYELGEFLGEATVTLPAYGADEATAYVYYSFTVAEDGAYMLSTELNDVDVNLSKPDKSVVAVWNIKSEAYEFPLEAGVTYLLRLADFRAETVGGDMKITLIKSQISLPAAFEGTWTDKEQNPSYTVVLSAADDAWSLTFNGDPVALTLLPRNMGYTFTVSGVDYEISFVTDLSGGRSIFLSWDDDYVALYLPGGHPVYDEGSEENPIEIEQAELAKDWTVDIDPMQGNVYYTFTADETKQYVLTIGDDAVSIEIEKGSGGYLLMAYGAGDSVFELTAGESYLLVISCDGMTASFTVAEYEGLLPFAFLGTWKGAKDDVSYSIVFAPNMLTMTVQMGSNNPQSFSSADVSFTDGALFFTLTSSSRNAGSSNGEKYRATLTDAGMVLTYYIAIDEEGTKDYVEVATLTKANKNMLAVPAALDGRWTDRNGTFLIFEGTDVTFSMSGIDVFGTVTAYDPLTGALGVRFEEDEDVGEVEIAICFDLGKGTLTVGLFGDDPVSFNVQPEIFGQFRGTYYNQADADDVIEIGDYTVLWNGNEVYEVSYLTCDMLSITVRIGAEEVVFDFTGTTFTFTYGGTEYTFADTPPSDGAVAPDEAFWGTYVNPNDPNDVIIISKDGVSWGTKKCVVQSSNTSTLEVEVDGVVYQFRKMSFLWGNDVNVRVGSEGAGTTYTYQPQA